MVRVESFTVEQWMDKYENTPGVLNIAETCASSVSVDELRELSHGDDEDSPFNTKTKLTYGAIRGSATLRERVASLCSDPEGETLPVENVVITAGAINANFLLLYALVGPGDHVVCVYPTYQQLYSVPESLGADVSLWRLQEDKGYIPNADELESLVNERTKMIIINNPNNPSGATIPTETLRQIASFAEKRGIILFSDEVYRPLFHDGFENNPRKPLSAAALGYGKTIVTGSMSKAFALAGIRVGWIASPDKSIIESVVHARDYTNISVSQVDDQIASYALSPSVQAPLLERNLSLTLTNKALVEEFVNSHSSVCSWLKPTAGTTGFVQFRSQGKPVNDVEFCVDVLKEKKILFCPGSHCFGRGADFQGYVRMGYAFCDVAVLKEALEKLSQYCKTHLE